MKKEIIAFAALLLVFSAALFNIHMLRQLSGEVIALIEEAEGFVQGDDWGAARKRAVSAAEIWEGRHPYTHIVLRQTEIESVTNVLNDLIKEIYAEESGAALGAMRAAARRMKSVVSIERITLGNIF